MRRIVPNGTIAVLFAAAALSVAAYESRVPGAFESGKASAAVPAAVQARLAALSTLRPTRASSTAASHWGQQAAVAPSADVTTFDARLINVEDLELPIVKALNAHRRKRGLRPLRASVALARAGDAHAAALGLAGVFTHSWPDGRPFTRWIKAYYPPLRGRSWMVGENLLWAEGAVTPEQALAMWLQSPMHRRILERRSWRQIGLGVVRVDGAGGFYEGRNVYIVACEFGARV